MRKLANQYKRNICHQIFRQRALLSDAYSLVAESTSPSLGGWVKPRLLTQKKYIKLVSLAELNNLINLYSRQWGMNVIWAEELKTSRKWTHGVCLLRIKVLQLGVLGMSELRKRPQSPLHHEFMNLKLCLESTAPFERRCLHYEIRFGKTNQDRSAHNFQVLLFLRLCVPNSFDEHV